MTTEVDIVNRSLQSLGTRTTITASEYANGTSNEAIQAAICVSNNRDSLLRMAPWDCATAVTNLTYITSLPGTPENSSPATSQWQPGQPMPPWLYEYQYPWDCLRACWIVPQYNNLNGGIPISPVSLGVPEYSGRPVRFKIAVDKFYTVTGISIVAGGTGYAAGNILTLPGSVAGSVPIGAPVQLLVTSVGTGGIVTGASIVDQINGEDPAGGSYFTAPTGTLATTGASGTGATFGIASVLRGDQRVILTNQQLAALVYVRQITDPNVMDDLFQDAWVEANAASLCMALTGDKAAANLHVQLANKAIAEARSVDGNEGLTINDITPDWLRTRGVGGASDGWSPNVFDWGSAWQTY